MKKVWFLLLLITLPGANLTAAETKTSLTIATGGVAGIYYPLGKGIAGLLTKHVPGLEVKAVSSGASAANINLIARHEAALALVQNDAAFRMAGNAKPVKNLRMIASLYPEHVQFITSSASGIKTFRDIKGKRISIGAPGSGTADSVSAIFSAAGLRPDIDFKADRLDFNDTAERIQDDQLDGGFVLAGYPTPAVTALFAQKDISLVSFDDELLNNLVENYPYFTKDVIPVGAYIGMDRDIPTPAVMAVLVCDSELADDLVYNITKALFENLAELAPVHDKAKLIAPGKALTAAAITVHPGAAKYYTEKGLEVPAF